MSPKKLRDALRYFESDVKEAFNPLDRNCQSQFDVPLPGVDDDDQLGISDGYLKISKCVAFENTSLTHSERTCNQFIPQFSTRFMS